MATDYAHMELTREQKERLARIAERAGKDYREVLDELLSVPCHSDAGQGSSSPKGATNLHDALEAIGAIGCVKGAPADLSTNPAFMEGFGKNASKRGTD